MSIDGAGLVQMGAAVRRNALAYPDRIAYVFGDVRLTWPEVDALTDRLAHRFAADGVGPRDHVAILGHNSHFFPLVEFAVFKLGAAALILNPALKDRSLAGQINHADAKVVVTGDHLQPHIEAIRGSLGAELYYTWDIADETPETLNLARPLARDEPYEPFPIAAVRPEDIATIIFSSGTTGVPKGAINTYWNCCAKAISMALDEQYQRNEIGLLVTPICMGGTQLMSLWPYALLGMTAIIAPGFNPGDVLTLIERERVNAMFCVPTMINALSQHPDFHTRELSCLRRIVSAGSTLPIEVFQRVKQRGIDVLELYGTSETGGGIAMPCEQKPLNPKSVGRPMVGFEARVVDDAGRDVPDNEPGEIVMRGDCVAVGYYKQPEIQADTYRNGWFHTGDIGRRDDAGYYYLMDRKKDLIITGGLNVYPAEVEQVLYEFNEVYECAVVGLPHDHWGEAVTAFVVLREDAEATGEAIRARLHDTLADYQVPKAVVIVEALPKTIFGKLYKIQLRNDHAGHYSKV